MRYEAQREELAKIEELQRLDEEDEQKEKANEDKQALKTKMMETQAKEAKLRHDYTLQKLAAI